MKLRYLHYALFALLPLQAIADTAAVRIGGGSWDHDPSGVIRYDNGGVGTNADLDSDLNLKTDKEGYAFVQVEHPVPLIPNVRIMSTALKNAGSGTVTTTFTYGGNTYTSGTNVTTELTLDHTDFTFYWQLLDNIVSFDLGLNVKAVDGKASIDDGATLTTNTFDGLIPMGYAAVGVSPLEGLEIRAELSSLSVGDSSITDTTAKISYTTDYLLGIEAGIRKINLELDAVDNVYTNMDFEGPFIGVYVHF